jgi:hypothetical protein
MPALSREWIYWALLNGLPAVFATLAFLTYAPFDKLFAWDVEHRPSGIFLGTGFLLRAALFVHIITAVTWDEIRWMTWGNAVFAGVLLGVTMVWGERFKWQRLIALVWLFLYIEEPVWMLSLAPGAQAAATSAGPVPGAAINLFSQGVLWAEAVVMLAAGIYLFLLNRAEKPFWPWRPDLVSARVMAGFPLAWATWAPTLALARRWVDAQAGVLLNIIWLGAILASLLVFRAQFDFSQRPTRVYTVVVGALFGLLLIAYVLQLM